MSDDSLDRLALTVPPGGLRMPESSGFYTYDQMIPDLPPREAPYLLTVQQLVGQRTGVEEGPLEQRIHGELEALETFLLRVEGPRFSLDPAEIVACCPPASSRDVADTTLPHVTLKRRTLPWERGQGPEGLPWLALLVLQEGEAELLRGAPLSALRGLADIPEGRCDQLRLPHQRLLQLLPTPQELAQLCHVRQFPLGDREVGDDEDGFVSLVLANRLPAPASEALAALVSLEGLRGIDGAWQADPGVEPWGGERYTPVVRLPVLSHWRFRTGAGGDFEERMEALRTRVAGEGRAAGVGLFAEESGGRFTLERRQPDGGASLCSYRGPLTPLDPAQALTTRPAITGAAPPIGPAAARELGRLMTLSKPEVLSDLRRFRDHQWGFDVEVLTAGALEAWLGRMPEHEAPLPGGGRMYPDLSALLGSDRLEALRAPWSALERLAAARTPGLEALEGLVAADGAAPGELAPAAQLDELHIDLRSTSR